MDNAVCMVAYRDRCVSVVLFIITANPVAGDTPRDSTDGVSMRSFVSSKVGSPQPGDDDNGDGLHLIKYVQFVNCTCSGVCAGILNTMCT